MRTDWRRLLLGAFVVYLYGVLGYLGTSHRHEADLAAHADCQLCHISTQPSLAEAADVAPIVASVLVAYAPREVYAMLSARHLPFLSRGPPSV